MGRTPVLSEDKGYKRLDRVDVSNRILEDLPRNYIEEIWRRVVIDVSIINIDDQFDDLVDWLNRSQSISLGINGKTKDESMELGLRLWDRTGLVVNTIGCPDNPALTYQARAQEGEIFGEFPPRSLLKKYTKFPVVVPSSTPSYEASYTSAFLEEQGQMQAGGRMGSFFRELSNVSVKGHCMILNQYLLGATMENPS